MKLRKYKKERTAMSMWWLMNLYDGPKNVGHTSSYDIYGYQKLYYSSVNKRDSFRTRKLANRKIVNMQRFVIPHSQRIEQFLPFKVKIRVSSFMDTLYYLIGKNPPSGGCIEASVLRNWCSKNVYGYWGTHDLGGFTENLMFRFKDENDAIMFKLTFSDAVIPSDN